MTMVAARNLLSYRSSQSVWDRRGWHGATIEERLRPWVVSISGVGLVAFGASRPSRLRPFYLGAGAALLACAVAGRRIRTMHGELRRRLRLVADSDQVTIETMDSFPASDAPSSNATTVAGGRSEAEGLRCR